MIKLKNVYKRLSERDILRGVDLEIETGETLVILGRSGIGKSVTLRHIVGLMQPDAGDVEVLGKNVAHLTPEEQAALRLRVGYLFQDGALLNWLTIGQNVALPLKEHTHLGAHVDIDARVDECLAHVELQDAINKYPNQISGGMRKRAGLARALVLQPEVVLYDEPTSGLDPISSSIINNLIRHLQRTFALTQVVVTHDMNSAYEIADRLALLHNGRIQAIGTPAEFQNSTDAAVDQFTHGKVEGPLSRGADGATPPSGSQTEPNPTNEQERADESRDRTPRAASRSGPEESK